MGQRSSRRGWRERCSRSPSIRPRRGEQRRMKLSQPRQPTPKSARFLFMAGGAEGSQVVQTATPAALDYRLDMIGLPKIASPPPSPPKPQQEPELNQWMVVVDIAMESKQPRRRLHYSGELLSIHTTTAAHPMIPLPNHGPRITGTGSDQELGHAVVTAGCPPPLWHLHSALPAESPATRSARNAASFLPLFILLPGGEMPHVRPPSAAGAGTVLSQVSQMPQCEEPCGSGLKSLLHRRQRMRRSDSFCRSVRL